MIAAGSAGRSAAWQVAAFLVPFAVYVFTLAPTVTYEDSGSFLAAAVHLGVAHPPGFPLWCLLAHAFTWLPVGDLAWRVHLCSAFFAALSTWLAFRVTFRLTNESTAALVAALALGVSSVLWSQAVVAEVYTLNAFFTLLSVELVLGWQQDRRDRWLYALAMATGLSLTNHPMAAGVASVAALWVLAIDWRRALAPRVIAVGALLLALGLSVYLYLPIRAAAQPPVNWGNPDTLERVVAHVSREMYRQQPERFAGDTADVALHTAHAWYGIGRGFGLPFALLAAGGTILLLGRRRDAGLATLAIAWVNTLGLNAILHAPANPLHLFAHRVYYIPAHAMAAVWLGTAVAALLGSRTSVRRKAVLAGLGVLLAATGIWNAPYAQRRGDERARDLGLDVLDSIPEGAGLLAADVVAFPVAYLKFVEGERPDVQLLSTGFASQASPLSGLVTTEPLTEQMFAKFPELRGHGSLPRGLVYQVVPEEVARRASYASFRALPGSPRGPASGWPAGDPFDRAARTKYAAYHARLGAKFRARGLHSAAASEFDRAEILNPDDPFVSTLLVEIYRHFDVRRERWEPILQDALDSLAAEGEGFGASRFERERLEKPLAEVRRERHDHPEGQPRRTDPLAPTDR